MSFIKTVLAWITSFLFITWLSNRIFIGLTTYANKGFPSSVGEAFDNLLVTTFKSLISLIFVIPALIYRLLHAIFFSTNYETDSTSMLFIIVPSALLWVIFKSVDDNVVRLNKKKPSSKKQRNTIYVNTTGKYESNKAKRRREAEEAKKKRIAEEEKRKKQEEAAKIAKEIEKMEKASNEFLSYYKNLNSLIISTNSWGHINYYNAIYESFITLKNHSADNRDWNNFHKMLTNLKKRLVDLENWANTYLVNNDQYDDAEPSTPNKESDPYDILGVNRNMTIEQINEKYHEIIKLYHPDKVQNLGDELKKLAEQKSKEINEAYSKIENERNKK